MTTSTTRTPGAGRGHASTFSVEQPPQEVFDAILDVGAWWTGEVDGRADRVGAEFSYRHPPQHYSVQQVVELDPGRRVAWRVTDSHLAGISEPAEWTGSLIVFDIAPTGEGAELRFTHVGLVPDVECFDACSTAWLHYVNGSLRSLITTGEGLPDPWSPPPAPAALDPRKEG
jgi:hypothetical protein